MNVKLKKKEATKTGLKQIPSKLTEDINAININKTTKKLEQSKSHASYLRKKAATPSTQPISPSLAAIRLQKKKKLIDEAPSDVSFSSEESKLALVTPKPPTQSKKKKKSITKNEQETEQEPKINDNAIDDLKQRLLGIYRSYDLALLRSHEIEELLNDVNVAFMSLSTTVCDHNVLLQNKTIQKFHEIEMKKMKIFKRFYAIEYMVREFGDDLGKTRKNLYAIEM